MKKVRGQQKPMLVLAKWQRNKNSAMIFICSNCVDFSWGLINCKNFKKQKQTKIHYDLKSNYQWLLSKYIVHDIKMLICHKRIIF
jgi:hypothetical protein